MTFPARHGRFTVSGMNSLLKMTLNSNQEEIFYPHKGLVSIVPVETYAWQVNIVVYRVHSWEDLWWLSSAISLLSTQHHESSFPKARSKSCVLQTNMLCVQQQHLSIQFSSSLFGMLLGFPWPTMHTEVSYTRHHNFHLQTHGFWEPHYLSMQGTYTSIFYKLYF